MKTTIEKTEKKNTANEKITADEIKSLSKSILKHPLVKVGIVIGGGVILCYTSIFIMNLSSKMVHAYKGLGKEINS